MGTNSLLRQPLLHRAQNVRSLGTHFREAPRRVRGKLDDMFIALEAELRDSGFPSGAWEPGTPRTRIAILDLRYPRGHDETP